MAKTLKYENYIAHYRSEEADCLKRAELEQNEDATARWIKIAEEWARMAEKLERRIKPVNVHRDAE